MVEAKLILDLIEGAKLRNGMLVLKAAERVCQFFGGCSFVIGAGCWYHNERFVFDPGVTFTVGLDPSVWLEFEWLAMQLAQGQETVYLVSPQGRVTIPRVVPLTELPSAAREFLRLDTPGAADEGGDAWFSTAPGGEFDRPEMGHR